jgi:diguanylate cyclase (GGDEF)-like protein
MQHQSVVPAVERESARLAALERYDVLGTPPEASFDRITRLAKKLFAVPIAVVSFADAHRLSHKASVGLAVKEVPREDTFCKHVIADGNPLIVPDATNDLRFRQHPSVVADPHVRFYAGAPLKTSDGHSVGVLCIADHVPRSFDAAELAVLEDLAGMVMGALELRLCANEDNLTGALSRRAFKEELERATDLALRHRHDLSAIALDLDQFKAINDTYGHAAGDAVLRRTVQACLGQLRNTDRIGRLAGDEFAILLPYTSQASAIQVAEKLREAIQQLRIPCRERIIKVTASLGIASLDCTTRDVETLLDHADQALCSAKSAGRNRCMGTSNSTHPVDESRRRVLKAGQILFNGRSSTINCTVRFLSDRGATLEVSSSAGVPSRFDLVIASDQVDKPCRVLSLGERRIEAGFC